MDVREARIGGIVTVAGSKSRWEIAGINQHTEKVIVCEVGGSAQSRLVPAAKVHYAPGGRR